MLELANISSFGIALILGAVSVGCTTLRTIKIIDGKPASVFFLSVIFSCIYLYSIKYIVEGDMYGYWGFSIGAALITTYLAFKRKNEGS